MAASRSMPSGSVSGREEADQDRAPRRGAAASSADGGTTLSDRVGVPRVAGAWRRPRCRAASGRPASSPAPGLDHDLVALLRELAHDVGDERDAALAGGRLGGDADPQGSGTVPERVIGCGQVTGASSVPASQPRPARFSGASASGRRVSAGRGRTGRASSALRAGRLRGLRRGLAGARGRGGRRRRRRASARRGLLRARHRGERERLAGERGERLGGDPHRGLRAGAGVADLAARGGERAQVGDRRSRAVAALAVGLRPGGDERLDRPRGRLRVRRAAGLERVAAVGVLAAGEEARGAAGGRGAACGRRRRAPAARRRCRRSRRRRPWPAKLKPPSGLAWPRSSGRRCLTARSVGRGRPRAGRRSRTRSCSRGWRTSRWGGAWRAARLHEVAVAELRRQARGAEEQDRAVDLAEVADVARVGADVGDEVVLRDVARVAAGGGEPEPGPAAVEAASSAGPVSPPKPPSAFWAACEPGERAVARLGRAAARRRRATTRREQRRPRAPAPGAS